MNTIDLVVVGVDDGWILLPQSALSDPHSNETARFVKVAELPLNSVLYVFREKDVAYFAEMFANLEAMQHNGFKSFDDIGTPATFSTVLVNQKGATLIAKFDSNEYCVELSSNQ